MLFVAILETHVSEHITAVRMVTLEVISTDIAHAEAKVNGIIKSSFPHHYLDEISPAK